MRRRHAPSLGGRLQKDGAPDVASEGVVPDATEGARPRGPSQAPARHPSVTEKLDTLHRDGNGLRTQRLSKLGSASLRQRRFRRGAPKGNWGPSATVTQHCGEVPGTAQVAAAVVATSTAESPQPERGHARLAVTRGNMRMCKCTNIRSLSPAGPLSWKPMWSNRLPTCTTLHFGNRGDRGDGAQPWSIAPGCRPRFKRGLFTLGGCCACHGRKISDQPCPTARSPPLPRCSAYCSYLLAAAKRWHSIDVLGRPGFASRLSPTWYRACWVCCPPP